MSIEKSGSTSTVSSEGNPALNQRRSSVEISRPILTENAFQQGYQLENGSDQRTNGTSIRQRIRKQLTAKSALKLGYSLVPILSWLPKYEIKKNAIGDAVAGVTVGISRVPIAMAYALLASLPPVYGLYAAFFPCLIYTFLGTSRHIALGAEAVTSIMVAGVLDNVVDKQLGTTTPLMNNIVATTASPINEEEIRTDAASSLLMLVALVQIGMFILRMGIITTYFSEPLIRGFTTGACCHIFTSQFKEMLGIKIPKIKDDYFVLPKSYIEIFARLGHCNAITVLISVITILAMVTGSEILDYEAYKGRCRKKVDGKTRQRLPIPTDLLVVIIALIASTFGDFADKYGVAVVGDIPIGLPPPKIPSAEYFSIVLPDIFAIAVVGFAISYSAAKVYAKKFDYEVNANQEFMGYGAAGLVSSFFNCYPFSSSICRSGIQEGAGGKTQIASIISCGVILLTLFLIAPLLSQLPKCALAVMIILAMRSMFRHFADLPKLWKVSKIDFLIWVVTWLSVVLLGVHIGLYFGVIFSLLSVIVRTQNPKTSLMARVEGTGIYREESGIKSAAEDLAGIKIFRFSSSLCFVNVEYFKKSLYSKVGINPRKMTTNKDQTVELQEKSSTEEAEKEDIATTSLPIHSIIVDCSMMGFIDIDGMQTLQTIAIECDKLNINVLFASANRRIRSTLKNSDVMNSMDQIRLDQMFVTLHDAVEHALVMGNQQEYKNNVNSLKTIHEESDHHEDNGGTKLYGNGEAGHVTRGEDEITSSIPSPLQNAELYPEDASCTNAAFHIGDDIDSQGSQKSDSQDTNL